MQLIKAVRLSAEQEAQKYDLSKLKAEAENLSSSYLTAERTGKSFIEGDISAAVYSAMRMPATFCAISSALEETLKSVKLDGEYTLLDIGTGTGSAVMATDHLLNIKKAVCFERETSMQKAAERHFAAFGGISGDIEWVCDDIRKTESFPKSDIVTASYVFNELPINEGIKLAEKLWNSADKLLLIVERGTPAGYKLISEIRKMLIHFGARIAAPCGGNYDCPLKPDDWCHFTCRVERSRLQKILKRGDAPYEDEKFCYIAVSKENVNPAPRVLRHPKISAGKIEFPLCSGGEIKNVICTKKNKDLWKATRKTKSGDSFDLPENLE